MGAFSTPLELLPVLRMPMVDTTERQSLMRINSKHASALLYLLGINLTLLLGGCVEPEVVYREPPPPVVTQDEPLVEVREAPPPLPVYEQPEVPGPGYLWTPGYWAWNGETYYWVPGTWVRPPRPAVLWTPGYWGAGDGGVFIFHAGYWGAHVGFYGGISYGHGYNGEGYEGGRWNNNKEFEYNTAVNSVNVTNIHNTYNKTVINNITINNISYNGGNGGVGARPTAQEQAAQHEEHLRPTPEQAQHVQAASNNRALFISENHGAPPIAATPRPGAFNDHAVIPARTDVLRQEMGRQIPASAPTPEESHPQVRSEPAARPEPPVEKAIVPPPPTAPSTPVVRNAASARPANAQAAHPKPQPQPAAKASPHPPGPQSGHPSQPANPRKPEPKPGEAEHPHPHSGESERE